DNYWCFCTVRWVRHKNPVIDIIKWMEMGRRPGPFCSVKFNQIQDCYQVHAKKALTIF
ncbi:Hypothetical protein FKW44_008648, partial [Caligus rogercresseyi]